MDHGHDQGDIADRRRGAGLMRQGLESAYPDEPIPYDRLLEMFDADLARLDELLAAAESDPRRAEHFERILLKNFPDREYTADALRAAVVEDYFFTVAELEAFARRGEILVMRRCTLDVRDGLGD